MIGTVAGVVRASAIRRVGGHRRWDAEGLLSIRGTPWKTKPTPDDEEVTVTMIPLPPDEQLKTKTLPQGEATTRRIMLRRADFFKHGFTDGCPACKMIVSGKVPERGGNKLHTEACRSRMETLLQDTAEGKLRLQRYHD